MIYSDRAVHSNMISKFSYHYIATPVALGSRKDRGALRLHRQHRGSRLHQAEMRQALRPLLAEFSAISAALQVTLAEDCCDVGGRLF